MPLPILSHPVADLLRYFEKTQRMFVEHLAEPVQLNCATAYSNKALSSVWNANHVRDAALSDGINPDDAFREVEEHFKAAGTRCAFWAINTSAPTAHTDPIIAELTARNYKPTHEEVLYLRQLPSLANDSIPGCKIIPARASYRHARQLAEEAVRELWGDNDQLVEARLLHLDDPHWDALLVLDDIRAIGGIAVHAVGEIGRIEHVYVVPSHRRRGIARVLMHRALEICARSLFKHVFLSTTQDNAPALNLYGSLGFERVGQSTTYRAPSC